MIKSMTGYGGASGACSGLEVTVELKSVNNRYFDCSVRLPRSLLFAEELLKSAVQGHISRGKVDVYVSVDSSTSDDLEIRINEPLLRSYLQAFSEISDRFIKHPSEVLSVGMPVKVRIKSVDKQRKRIGLTMKKA